MRIVVSGEGLCAFLTTQCFCQPEASDAPPAAAGRTQSVQEEDIFDRSSVQAEVLFARTMSGHSKCATNAML